MRMVMSIYNQTDSEGSAYWTSSSGGTFNNASLTMSLVLQGAYNNLGGGVKQFNENGMSMGSATYGTFTDSKGTVGAHTVGANLSVTVKAPTTGLAGTLAAPMLLPRFLPALGTAAAADGPLPIGDVIALAGVVGLSIHDAYYLAQAYGPAIARKMNAEIDRIKAKTLPEPGDVYMLIVENPVPATYLDVRGNPVVLSAGDLWKYGETTLGDNRYPGSKLYDELPGANLRREVIYSGGTQLQCKIVEKFCIYGHYFRNGSLPPGNRMFR